MDKTSLKPNMKLGVKFMPLIITAIVLILVIITTFLAFYQNHISGGLPYISDTGTIAPESCIFGQFLNIIWILFSFSMYCKYLQVKDILLKHNMSYEENLNRNTFILGLAASFGVSIVANFQETNCFIVHWIGAVMCFGLGSLYLCMQTRIYLQITPVIGQLLQTKIRILLSALSVLTFLVFFICAMISYKNFAGDSYLHWKPEDGGYNWHVTSTTSEWLCAITMMFYIALFKEEFQHMNIHEPIIDTGIAKFQSKRDSHPVQVPDEEK
ncbi:DNA damage-regulated autophagy modulator protein 2-like [Diorhabda sublineata]|uniref:DNA damage-regulated autophagy modulator protein 2-like n=1 Tax=Diorhabda sublineata TaxID=1163346 RepID=UPI0024E09EBE|nr:DNA damage-regulated autophagy modulator protein 2-like [Diorhabda sublineata]